MLNLRVKKELKKNEQQAGGLGSARGYFRGSSENLEISPIGARILLMQPIKGDAGFLEVPFGNLLIPQGE